MSQHVFWSTHSGRPVSVQMGWDAPLRHYFMIVAYGPMVESAPRDWAEIVYSNLSDVEIDGGVSEPGYYWNKLAELGVECAMRSEIDQQLRVDARTNASDRIVRYDSSAGANRP